MGWKSRRCGLKIISSTAAELWAAVMGTKRLPKYIRLVERWWGVKPEVRHMTDNMPLMQAMPRGMIQEEPGLTGAVEYLVQNLRVAGALPEWVETTEMRADGLTKFLLGA